MEAMLYQLLGSSRRRCSLAIDKLDRLHGADSTHVRDDTVLALPCIRPTLKLLPQPPAARQQLAIRECLEDRECSGTARWIATKRTA